MATYHLEKNLTPRTWRRTLKGPLQDCLKVFPKRFLRILIGIILGDGHLRLRSSFNCKMYLIHGSEQREYLVWKRDFLKSRIGFPNEIIEKKRYDADRDKTYVSYGVESQGKGSEALARIYSQFYQIGPNLNGEMKPRKTITRHTVSYFDRWTVLVLFVDDGWTEKARWGAIATYNFSLKENLLLQDWFFHVLGIRTIVQSKKRPISKGNPECHGVYYFIKFSENEHRKLVLLLAEIIPLSLPYAVIQKKLFIRPLSSFRREKAWILDLRKAFAKKRNWSDPSTKNFFELFDAEKAPYLRD